MAERRVKINHTTLKRIEVVHMIPQRQFGKTSLSAFQQFAAIAR